MHAGIAGRRMRQDVLIAFDEADLSTGPHILGVSDCGRCQEQQRQ
jgi:hypothetical protein